MPLSDEQLKDMLDAIAGVRGDITSLRDDVATVRSEARRNRSLARALAVLLAFAIVVSLVAVVIGKNAQNAFDDYKASIPVTRAASCVQFNAQQQAAREGTVQVASASIRAFANDPDHLSAAEQKLLDAYTARATAAAVEAFPYRDCSATGIRKYFENPPPDPGATETGE
jgi:hypothetical protein